MDPTRFDALARLVSRPTRRRLLAGALAALLTGAPLAPETAGEPRRERAQADRPGDGDRPTAKPDGPGAAGKRRKPKPKKCSGGKIKCGKTCANPATDPRHCGGCGNACGAGVACTDGACGGACDGDRIRCGGQCVDPRTDDAHCGTCGNACAAGADCQGGACVRPRCGPGLKDCNDESCIPDDEECCYSQDDCGPRFDNEIQCDLASHRCVCIISRFGICERFADKRGRCGECCPGAAPDNCRGDTSCRDGFDECRCADGFERCPGGSYTGQCTANPQQDSACCGAAGHVCDARFDEQCCQGQCVAPCKVGFNCFNSQMPCPTNRCEPCGVSGTGTPRICCENGCQEGASCRT